MRKRMVRPNEWRIHFGGHKTATTHLQETLFYARDLLQAMDVDVLPTEETREHVSPLLDGKLTDGPWRRFAGHRITGNMLLRALAPVRSGSSRIVWSEENLIGACVDALAPIPYPKLGLRLRLLHGLVKGRKVSFFLSIRSFDRVLPGAYATALRFPFRAPPAMAQIKTNIRQSPPSWFEIIQRIQHSLPDVPLRIWQQEEYRANSAQILSALVGHELPARTDLPPPQSTKTPSWQAVQMVEEKIKARGFKDRTAEVDAIYERFPATGPDSRYMPFSEPETEILKNKYCEDIAAIKTHFPQMMLSF